MGSRGPVKGSRRVVDETTGRIRYVPPGDPSPSTSTSESSSERPPESSSPKSRTPSLPPPRTTNQTSRLQPESPPLFGSTYRKVPEDEKEREDAFKSYRFYSRSLTGAWSKLLDLASDEPADEDERAAANDAICLMMYQLDLTMLDWRVSVPLALGAPLISRAPAIQKKWGKKKRVQILVGVEAPSQPKEPETTGARVSPFPQAVKGES